MFSYLTNASAGVQSEIQYPRSPGSHKLHSAKFILEEKATASHLTHVLTKAGFLKGKARRKRGSGPGVGVEEWVQAGIPDCWAGRVAGVSDMGPVPSAEHIYSL
jgi:hypothetical protein